MTTHANVVDSQQAAEHWQSRVNVAFHVKRTNQQQEEEKQMTESNQRPEEPVSAEQLASAQFLGLAILRAARDNLEHQQVRGFDLNIRPDQFGLLGGIVIELSKAENETDSFIKLFRFVVNVCARMSRVGPLMQKEIQDIRGAASGTVLAFLLQFAHRADACPPDEHA
jgi:hypothetical protein